MLYTLCRPLNWFFFFFKQKTAYEMRISDWSSDVCSSDLEVVLADGATGFIRKNDLARDRADQRPDRFAVGEKVDAKITQIDAKSRKVSLSIKAREVEEEKKAMAE